MGNELARAGQKAAIEQSTLSGEGTQANQEKLYSELYRQTPEGKAARKEFDAGNITIEELYRRSGVPQQ